MNPTAKQSAIDDITVILEGGTLRHQVGLEIPLERVAEAHQAIEAGNVIGCAIVGLRS
jgi:hypothetical protein